MSEVIDYVNREGARELIDWANGRLDDLKDQIDTVLDDERIKDVIIPMIESMIEDTLEEFMQKAFVYANEMIPIGKVEIDRIANDIGL